MFHWSEPTPSTVVPGAEVIDFVSQGFISFEFDRGVIARVVRLHLQLTYDGWIEGLPSSRSNDMFTLPAMKRPPACFQHFPRPVHICRPPRRKFLANVADTGEAEHLREVELFPRLRFTALVERWTDSPLRCRQLIVVWQQMDDEKVAPERVREELRSLDWDALSVELEDHEFG
jgi:hypothetical protein